MNNSIIFETDYIKILEKIEKIQAVEYGLTRNYINGAVTYLSPYISRGVISTKQVYASCLELGFKPESMEKLIQELAWRDYWQLIWMEKGNAIDSDLKNKQEGVENNSISEAFLNCSTGILAIDRALENFYETGYLHNHVRMYIASMSTNIAKSHWHKPAQWMYYHLLDGDWASNALSWQWVCGANSGKLYFANQENIDKHCRTQQWKSYLDLPYDELSKIPVPTELRTLVELDLKTGLPTPPQVNLNRELPTFMYTWYNLDPKWRIETKGNRILILEPSHFQKYPISPKSMQFMLDLAKNIPDIQVFVGEFADFCQTFNSENMYFKEHPTNMHFAGIQDDRDWMTSVKGYHASFFTFWKKARKELIFS